MLFVVVLVSAVSAQKPAKEPVALTEARDTYDARIRAAVAPITGEYLRELDKMMKSFGAAGDLESAQAVQNEIKEIKELSSGGAKSVIRNRKTTQSTSRPPQNSGTQRYTPPPRRTNPGPPD